MGNKAGLVLDDSPEVIIELNFVFTGATDNTHWGDIIGQEVPSSLGGEGRKLLVRGYKPIGLVRNLHGLFVEAWCSDVEGIGMGGDVVYGRRDEDHDRLRVRCESKD